MKKIPEGWKLERDIELQGGKRVTMSDYYDERRKSKKETAENLEKTWDLLRLCNTFIEEN